MCIFLPFSSLSLLTFFFSRSSATPVVPPRTLQPPQHLTGRATPLPAVLAVPASNLTAVVSFPFYLFLSQLILFFFPSCRSHTCVLDASSHLHPTAPSPPLRPAVPSPRLRSHRACVLEPACATPLPSPCPCAHFLPLRPAPMQPRYVFLICFFLGKAVVALPTAASPCHVHRRLPVVPPSPLRPRTLPHCRRRRRRHCLHVVPPCRRHRPHVLAFPAPSPRRLCVAFSLPCRASPPAVLSPRPPPHSRPHLRHKCTLTTCCARMPVCPPTQCHTWYVRFHPLFISFLTFFFLPLSLCNTCIPAFPVPVPSSPVPSPSPC